MFYEAEIKSSELKHIGNRRVLPKLSTVHLAKEHVASEEEKEEEDSLREHMQMDKQLSR